jgi:molecular chaperone GrpE
MDKKRDKSEKDVKKEPEEQIPAAEKTAAPQKAAEEKKAEAPKKAPEEKKPEPSEAEQAKAEAEKARADLAREHDSYLRLAAEYDNFRKRSQKERDNLYTDVRAETIEKFLPVYDNLERALAQATADDAYKKGVEMTMNQLVKILDGLGAKPFGAAGDAFDPALHNAVMHQKDEKLGENIVAEVFQKGFTLNEKVIRFAMVKVAN